MYLSEDELIGSNEVILAYHYQDCLYMLKTYYGPKWELRSIDPKGGTNALPYLAVIEKVRK